MSQHYSKLISNLTLIPPRRTLANAFPACGLGVSAATDGIIFRSDVFAASQTDRSQWTSVMKGLPWSDQPHPAKSGFGNKAVLVLVNVRLGTNAVNPIYYDSLKVSFDLPVGLYQPLFMCSVRAIFVDPIHSTSNSRDCGWTAEFLVLLCRLPRRLLVLPRSAFHPACHSAAYTYC